MSATNKTTNFELPLFIGTDIPSWLSDWNGSMNSIDSAMQTIKTTANGAASGVSGNTSSIQTINGELSTINSTLTNLGNSVQTISDNMGSFHRGVLTNPNTGLYTNYTMAYKYNKSLGYLSIYGATDIVSGQTVADNASIGNIGVTAAPGSTVTAYGGVVYALSNGTTMGGVINIGTNGNITLVSIPGSVSVLQIRMTVFVCCAGTGNGWPAVV